jgi:hypothetical protein
VRSNAHDTPCEVEADSDVVHDDIRDIVAIMDDARPPDTMPLAVMTYDLSTADTVSDPQDYYKECWVLRE